MTEHCHAISEGQSGHLAVHVGVGSVESTSRSDVGIGNDKPGMKSARQSDSVAEGPRMD